MSINTMDKEDGKISPLMQQLLDALKAAENRAALHSSDAALLNANNDRIFKICRKALEQER